MREIPVFGEKIPQNSPKTPTHIFRSFRSLISVNDTIFFLFGWLSGS
jgi:hypothetical protein